MNPNFTKKENKKIANLERAFVVLFCRSQQNYNENTFNALQKVKEQLITFGLY